MHFKDEKVNYFFQDEDTKKYVPIFFIVSFFLIILWLCFMARRYSFFQLITHMDALLLPLFPITAFLLIKEKKIGFLIAPLLFVFSTITGFNYMFRFENRFEFIDVYCVIVVFVSALFFLNIKKKELDQIPSRAVVDREAKIET